MSLINSTAIPSGATYEIEQSLRFNDADAPYLSRTPSSAGNRKTWTYSVWIKRGADNPALGGINHTLLSTSSGDGLHIRAGSNTDVFQFQYGTDKEFVTNREFRDTSGWYHIIFVYDSTNGTAADRVKLYINGVRETSFASASYPNQNVDGHINNNVAHQIGRQNDLARYFDGYMGEVNFIDGAAKAPADFGETGDYGEWKPIAYSGSYGTNGFFLNFATAADMGDDKSGNTNDWAENNIAATDQMLDSPTNNFSTFNPLDPQGTTSITFSEGNLKIVQAASWTAAVNNVVMTSGKWYWEVCGVDMSNSGMGVVKPFSAQYLAMDVANNGYFGDSAGGYGVNFQHGEAGDFFTNTTKTTDDYLSAYSNGDVVGVAYDADTGKIWIARNNTWGTTSGGLGNPSTGANEAATVSSPEGGVYAAFALENCTVVANFGQDSSFAGNKTAQGNQDGNNIGDFYYAPPTGFLALCTSNLPDVAVIPSEHFNTIIYSGDSSNKTLTGVGFQADLAWFKPRNQTWDNSLYDSVRGGSKRVRSNQTSAEDTSSSGYISSFNSDGYAVVHGGSNHKNVNQSGFNYVAWNWKANGSGSSNTNGSINSTVSANVDAGFSIVSYTGTATNATVGHGLSSAPEMVIIKNRSDGSYWIVGTDGLTSWSRYIPLNLTNAETNEPTQFNSTAPTSSVFSIGTNADVNGNTHNIIAYAFHSVDGYSKVGTYTGNGNADGAFIYTGFRPAFVICKMVTDAGEGWIMRDNARNPFNVVANHLNANQSYADSTASSVYADFLSNGFKQRANDSINNGSGKTYIYIAFAETPFKYSNAR